MNIYLQAKSTRDHHTDIQSQNKSLYCRPEAAWGNCLNHTAPNLTVLRIYAQKPYPDCHISVSKKLNYES